MAQAPDLAAQREAMKKVQFLAGRWSGDAVVTTRPGEPLKIRQTEDVQTKLDGLVLLIEGTGRDTAGKVIYNALATIAYDDANGTYRFRAYNNGRYLDTELRVSETGFEWGFSAGPAVIRNVMHLDERGDWLETTEVTIGTNPPRRTLEMRVRREK